MDKDKHLDQLGMLLSNEGESSFAFGKIIKKIELYLDDLSRSINKITTQDEEKIINKIAFLKDLIWEIKKVPSDVLRETQIKKAIATAEVARDKLSKLIHKIEGSNIEIKDIDISLLDGISEEIENIFNIFSLYIHRINTAWIFKIKQSAETFGVHKTRVMDAADRAEKISSQLEELNEKSSVRFLASDFISRKRALAFECCLWFLLMTSLFGLSGYLMFSFELRGEQLWQNRLIDLGIIGFIVTLGFWVGKNFRASLHQRAINEHRISTLKTFQAFYEKIHSSEMRDTVMVEVAQTIFGHTASGYGSDKEVNHSNGTLSDIVRAVSFTKSN